jgi:MFS family permease
MKNYRALILIVLVLVSSLEPVFSFLPLTRTSELIHHSFKTVPSAGRRNNDLSPRNKVSPLRLRERSNQKDHADIDEHAEQTFSWLWTLCLPLWLVYVSNQWSRSSIYYLVDFSDSATAFSAMNAAIGFDQVQYGLLASVAFTSLFAIASLGAGIAADRFNRKTLTVASAAGWSAAVLLTASAATFDQVLLARVAMGLACAFSTPTAYTLIRDRVPDNRQALASSVYGTGVALASGLASLTLLLDRQVGWRYALDGVAGFGLLAAVLAAVILPDDPKELPPAESEGIAADLEEKNALAEAWEGVTEVYATSPRVRLIFLGSFLRFCSGLCIGVWSAPFFRMVFAENQAEYAVTQAVISALLASLSGLLGGAAADWLSSSREEEIDADVDAVGRRLWVPVIGSLLAAPAWFLAVQTDASFEVAMFWLAIEYFVAECWFGPTISTLQASVGPRTGGTAQGMFTLTGAIANLAPSVLGYLYGQQEATGSDELSSLLAGGVCFGYLSSAVCFALAAQANEIKDSRMD